MFCIISFTNKNPKGFVSFFIVYKFIASDSVSLFAHSKAIKRSFTTHHFCTCDFIFCEPYMFQHFASIVILISAVIHLFVSRSLFVFFRVICF